MRTVLFAKKMGRTVRIKVVLGKLPRAGRTCWLTNVCDCARNLDSYFHTYADKLPTLPLCLFPSLSSHAPPFVGEVSPILPPTEVRWNAHCVICYLEMCCNFAH